ncbi:MAG: hypothetical protein OXC62_15325 [Aestuariivita sp.]|nr:hypothetical protein [Aestuariivita sp.]
MNEPEEPSLNGRRPNIAYIDEKDDELANFYTDAYDSDLFGKIYLLKPLQNIEEMLKHILSLDIDALITDFNLTEAAPLEYSGEQIVERFLGIRADFPCFIRTSFEQDALSSSADVNRVYSKDINADAHSGRSLFERVAQQIQKHQDLVKSWEEELVQLVAIPVDERQARHVSRLIELDHKLEASLGADAQVPIEVKKDVFRKRNELLHATENLIADMKRALGE